MNNREKLADLGASQDTEIITYHQERIRLLLDSPGGYGIRFQFLGIPMNENEQFAFFVTRRDEFNYAVDRNTRELARVSAKLDELQDAQDYAVQTIGALAGISGYDAGPPPTRADHSFTGPIEAENSVPKLSASLSPELVSAFHRFVCADLPAPMVGRFRTKKVWLATRRGEQRDAPVAPEQISAEIEALCADWNAAFQSTAEGLVRHKIEKMAQFHVRFLRIHPFLDGNGRTARALLVQQALDLFGRADITLLEKGASYYQALTNADDGSLDPLMRLIRPVVT